MTTVRPGAGCLQGDEDQHLERKSLRLVNGPKADFDDVARTAIAFANGAGGRIIVGIEDREEHPPKGQRIDPALVEQLRRRIGERTVNVQILPEVRSDGEDEYLVLTVPRSQSVASTSDGRYYLRVGDSCRPVVGDDVLRLAGERAAFPWETMTTLGVPHGAADVGKLVSLVSRLRASDRVKSSVKEKAPGELLAHYGLASGALLTNLGVLLVGTVGDRAKLGTAPVIQAIKFDERGTKVSKLCWDDYTLSPVELVDAVWEGVPDFRESYELPTGMFRTSVPAFEEVVVRELLVNALVHRPYTQRGDIFLNLRPDELEVVNPGLLPLGVTPRNILHTTQRRNDGLARLFHDLKLMEREGSGFDLMYERLLATGRSAPVASEGPDSVRVVVPRRVLHPGVVTLLTNVDQQFQLAQRERIALAMLAQTEGLPAGELASRLELGDAESLRPWIGRLLELGLVEQSGRTKATRYFVAPTVVKKSGLDVRTTLARVQPPRLRGLILEDLERYPDSPVSEIHRRLGAEIPLRTLQRSLKGLIDERKIEASGERRWRRYRVRASMRQGDGDGG